jgi:hypothetical protein
MKFSEAMLALEEGKKVRCTKWAHPEDYLYRTDEGTICFHEGLFPVIMDEWAMFDWEIVE